MLKTGSEAYIQIPDESEDRILHKGQVRAVSAELQTLVLEEEDLPIEAETDLFVFYEIRRKFHQQLARIQSVERESGLVVELQTIGDPVSAEGREYYRVSTISADLISTIGSEPDCPIRDISATGFAAVARASHAIGSLLPAEVRYGDVVHSGSVCVQSVRELRPGQIRYGFRYVETDDSSSELRDGLNQISLAVQREQLQRR